MKPIYLGSDHRGFPLKVYLKEKLKERGIPYEDFGTFSTESVDYPDYAIKVAEKVSKESTFGVLICMTGIGMSIAANKVRGIRAARVLSKKDAILSRRHNNANVLCIPGKGLKRERALEILLTFIEAPFDGGRHARRVRKVADYEKAR